MQISSRIKMFRTEFYRVKIYSTQSCRNVITAHIQRFIQKFEMERTISFKILGIKCAFICFVYLRNDNDITYMMIN